MSSILSILRSAREEAVRALASNAGTVVENGASTADAPTADSSFAISTKRTISMSQRAVVNKLLSTGIAARRGKPGGEEAVERLISGFWSHPLVRKRLPELKRLIDLSEVNPSQYRVKLAAYVADLRDYVHLKGQLKGWQGLIGQKAPGWAKAKRKVMRRYRAAMFKGDRAGVEKYTSLMAALALVKTRHIDDLRSDGTELYIDGDKKSVAGVVTGGRKLLKGALVPFVMEVGAEQVKTEEYKKYAAAQVKKLRLIGDIKDTYGMVADIRSGDAKRRARALKKLSKVLKGLSADDLRGMMDMDRMSSKAGVLDMLKAQRTRIADSRVKLACADPQSGRCQAALYRQRALNRPFGTPRRAASPFAHMVHPAVRAIRASNRQRVAQHLHRSRLLSMMRAVVANQEYVVGAKGNTPALVLLDPLKGYRPASFFPMKGRIPKRLISPQKKTSEEDLRWQRVELVATFVHELKRNEFIRPVVRMAEEAKGLDSAERARMGVLIADLRHLPPDKLVDRLPKLTFWAQTGAMLAAAAKLEKAAPDIRKAHAKTAAILRRAAKIWDDPGKMPEVDIAPYTKDVRKHLIRARELMTKKEKGKLTKAEAKEFARSLRLAALHFDHATTLAKHASDFIETGEWWIMGVSAVITLEAIGATILATAAIPETGGASAPAAWAFAKFAFANLVAAFTFTAVHTAGNVAIMGEEFSFKHFGYDLAWNFAVFMALGGVMRGAGKGVGKLRPEQMAKVFEEAGINYTSARFLQKLAVKYSLPEGTKLGEALVTVLGKESVLLGTELATFQGMETLKLATAAQGLTTRERPDFGKGFSQLWSGKSLLHGLLMIAGIRGFNYTLSRATGKVRGAEIKKLNEHLKSQIAFLEKGEINGRKLTTLARARLEKAIIGRMGRIGRLGGAVEKGSIDLFKRLIGYDETTQTFKPTVVREVVDGKGLAEEVGDVFGLGKEGRAAFAKGIDGSGLTVHELAYLQEAIARRQVEGASLVRDYRINRLLGKAGYTLKDDIIFRAEKQPSMLPRTQGGNAPTWWSLIKDWIPRPVGFGGGFIPGFEMGRPEKVSPPSSLQELNWRYAYKKAWGYGVPVLKGETLVIYRAPRASHELPMSRADKQMFKELVQILGVNFSRKHKLSARAKMLRSIYRVSSAETRAKIRLVVNGLISSVGRMKSGRIVRKELRSGLDRAISNYGVAVGEVPVRLDVRVGSDKPRYELEGPYKHYTSKEAFERILKSRRLKATAWSNDGRMKRVWVTDRSLSNAEVWEKIYQNGKVRGSVDDGKGEYVIIFRIKPEARIKFEPGKNPIEFWINQDLVIGRDIEILYAGQNPRTPMMREAAN